MATGKRKSSSGRSSSGRKTNSRRKKNEVQHENFTEEVILWIVLAVSILLFISNFGIGGFIGGAISSFFFGIFGLIAYIFPVILVIGTFFAASNKGNQIATVKIVSGCIFVLFLCMFLELVLSGSEAKGALLAYQYSAEHKTGGGLLGGFLAGIICKSFGLVGAYVIDVIAMIICLVLITERSALKGMQKGGRKVYETAKENNERYREYAEKKREERELRRMDRKVEGVALDTKVLPQKKEEKTTSDEVSEINIDKLLNQKEIEFPEIKEEQHITLTSDTTPVQEDTYEEEFKASPSAFSDEAIRALEASILEFDSKAEPAPVTAQKTEHEPQAFTEPDESLFSTEPAYQEPEEKADPLHKIEEYEAAPSAKTKKNAKPTEDDIKNDVEAIAEEMAETVPEKKYVFPPVELLKAPGNKQGDSRQHLQETAQKLQQTLKNFGVNVTITNISCGPSVTRYEIQPEMGVKVSKIVNLADDIKLNLAAADIRIEAPIPGKAAVGIEVPNKETVTVSFRELVDSREFKSHPSNISFCVGRDIGGNVTVADIAKMPHLLIAGATGSGKSVCINTIIMSILYKADPKDVKLIMVDPKVVELSIYNGIPHLLIPVVTDPKKAAGALHWAVAEMTDRYQKFAEANVRDLKGYNAKVDSLPAVEGEKAPEKLPQIVIIVDELADLMMVAPGDVEESICRLAQLARACGIHLIIATQRPSVNVITGLIKANMPSRIAFAVTSGIDSRTILDMNGAEKLLGKGDMLFNPQGVPKPLRVQGAFVSDKEVGDVVEFLKNENGHVSYNSSVEDQMNSIDSGNTTVSIDSGQSGDGRDAYFADAAKLLIDKEKGSIGMLQRYFKVGFNRAARIMDQLEEAGIVGPEEGTKPRKVLMSMEEFEQYEEEYL